MVYRIYVEKKSDYAAAAAALFTELKTILGIGGLTQARIVQRYDVENISAELFDRACKIILSEAPLDAVSVEAPQGDFVFAVEYLPGQFDQRSASAAECIQLISQGERPLVASAKIYVFNGVLSDAEKQKIQKYVINPVEARIADLAERQTLQQHYSAGADISVLSGFRTLTKNNSASETSPCRTNFITQYGLAMDADDLAFCIEYFKTENRDPTISELRVIDTYWSDHCRHTTFSTIIDAVKIDDEAAQNTYQQYLAIREKLYAQKNKPVTLMDIATIGAKYLSSIGKLQNWDKDSGENNACSIRIKVDVNGTQEDWLLMFKNETHNHPTEIEPFGGAATCIGGAIRDPLSGRAYVYQAMRVTGAGDPLAPIENTPTGKLPQRKLVVTAANGYSSYGNQIGLATGLVHEFYAHGYTAKRMEIGAVAAAVPLAALHREEPAAGDVIILLGGKTGRDGCGGATGSSKAHDVQSIESCGAEVQKGNAPEERKLQRLFRNPTAAALIKRCNDFGAGGVAVAIGELADGLAINLDAVPKKYEGLDGTELAISESQERMAIVVAQDDASHFIELANAENLEATIVATVTEQKRLVMQWRGKTIIDLSREFLSSNGAQKHTHVEILKGGNSLLRGDPRDLGLSMPPSPLLRENLIALASNLNVCGNKGLAERFDSTIGAASVLMPFGGKYQLTPVQVTAALLPTAKFPPARVPAGSGDGSFAETKTCSGMAFGFNPFISTNNPYQGAYLSVLESLTKLSAAGFKQCDAYLSFQEYFGKVRASNDSAEAARWGLPFAALLGALQAQLDFGVAAIGGKDSMSGSWQSASTALDVPPTLVSFAVAPGNAENIIGNEFKNAGNLVVWIKPASYKGIVPNVEDCIAASNLAEKLIAEHKAISVWAAGAYGAAEGLIKMSFGNRIGMILKNDAPIDNDLFAPSYGSYLIEYAGNEFDTDQAITKNISIIKLGITTDEYTIISGNEIIDLSEIQNMWESKLESLLPYRETEQTTLAADRKIPTILYDAEKQRAEKQCVGKRHTRQKESQRSTIRPRALIPVFPGTNCEYDTAAALLRAGADPDIFVVRNRTPHEVADSASELARRIQQSQMLVIPGGFSGGDEPDGSAKLIAAFFRGAQVADALMDLLQKRDGLILGICNGFQALIKLGLVPFGEICEPDPAAPTLTFNTIGRHQSMLIRTKITSNLSPWFLCEPLGAIHTIPISHGEGRFAATPDVVEKLLQTGRIASQYVDLDGNPTMTLPHNPNGSIMAIEGITSPDGRVLGKMAHSERSGANLYKNVPGNKTQKLFEGGVRYFL